MCVYIYIYIYINKCMYVCIYIYIYTYTHTVIYYNPTLCPARLIGRVDWSCASATAVDKISFMLLRMSVCCVIY